MSAAPPKRAYSRLETDDEVKTRLHRWHWSDVAGDALDRRLEAHGLARRIVWMEAP